MSGFDEWYDNFFDKNYYVPCASEAWNEQQKKIDAVLKHIENEEWIDEYGDKHCSVQKIKELLK